jgi:hypothetical protein
MDNNQGTGYCVGTGGYFPSVCGIDMAFEIEFYNGTFNTEHFLLHAAKDEAEKILDMNDQKQGKKMLEFLNNLIGGKGVVRLADSVIGYKPYTEWVYWCGRDREMCVFFF